ncbi:hypothetical protein [Myceligenerans salitolerans]|uniref:Uncharacterized protein n=1 Tax=Myceligenerans salitolerans TaxID=1230528 RepID=A0ABS3IA57_9MICO|nr:hypothetical protein [Myceligenerans salitolerans]MBO0609892.1 hypothetical protein [Myceligenerans salitolerans]
MRPNWTLSLVIVGLAAILGLGAHIALIILGLLAAIGCFLVSSSALGVNPFNPITVFTSMFKKTTVTHYVVSLVALACGIALMLFAMRLPGVAQWIASRVDGDPDLMTCLLVCGAALILCSLQWAYCGLQVRVLCQAPAEMLEEFEVDANEGWEVRRRFRYWASAVEFLAVTFVTLIPAAVLSNWAWNMLASVIFPLFLLSLKHARTEQASRGETRLSAQG